MSYDNFKGIFYGENENVGLNKHIRLWSSDQVVCNCKLSIFIKCNPKQ